MLLTCTSSRRKSWSNRRSRSRRRSWTRRSRRKGLPHSTLSSSSPPPAAQSSALPAWCYELKSPANVSQKMWSSAAFWFYLSLLFACSMSFESRSFLMCRIIISSWSSRSSRSDRSRSKRSNMSSRRSSRSKAKQEDYLELSDCLVLEINAALQL